jgi:hypothetical protein
MHQNQTLCAECRIYPISHLVVVKDELLHAHPWLAEELWSLFTASKDDYLGRLRNGAPKTHQDEAMQAMRQVIGDDPLLYGVAPNRKTMEAFIRLTSSSRSSHSRWPWKRSSRTAYWRWRSRCCGG